MSSTVIIVVLLVVCLLSSSSAAGGYIWYRKKLEQTAENAIKGLKEGLWTDASANPPMAGVVVLQSSLPGLTPVLLPPNDVTALVNRKGTIQMESAALRPDVASKPIHEQPPIHKAAESELVRTKLGAVLVESDSRFVVTSTNGKKTTYVYVSPLSEWKGPGGSSFATEITTSFKTTEAMTFFKGMITNPAK